MHNRAHMAKGRKSENMAAYIRVLSYGLKEWQFIKNVTEVVMHFGPDFLSPDCKITSA